MQGYAGDENMNNEPLPHFADRFALGRYDEEGAILPSRDGRVCGNGTVYLVSGSTVKGDNNTYCWITTDAGNRMTLNLREVEEMFWPPKWIRKTYPGKDAVLLEQCAEAVALGDWRNTLKHGLGGHRVDTNEALMASIAISLKRIADALTYRDPAMPAMNIHEILSGIEMNTRQA